jgi:hypothetical protein
MVGQPLVAKSSWFAAIHMTKSEGGKPLLKFLAVDWFKSDQRIDHVARQPGCCMQVTLHLCRCTFFQR